MSQGQNYPSKENDKKWEALLRISEEAHSAINIEEFVATIHGILAELVSARNFFIALYDEQSNKYFFPYFEDEFDSIETTGVSSAYDESLETTLYELSGTLTDYVRMSGKPIRFPHDRVNRLYKTGELKLFGSQSNSWLGVPLKLSGTTVGVMAVQSYDQKDAYSVKDEELMVFVSDHIARAIENVRAEERIRKQHQLVLEQKQAITDSISYARRIQKAVLPSPAYLGNILSDFFFIYKPKDVIGGDFYWVREINRYKVAVVADCTGHGVPGALMSMLGVTLLNEQFRTFGIREPGVILGHLRTKVKEILAQEGSVKDQKDGMDMAITIVDPQNQTLQFAGANIPLLLIRKKPGQENRDRINEEKAQGAVQMDLKLSIENEDYALCRLKADKQPIGVHWEEVDFTTRKIRLRGGDSLYMFTDGFTDQYGGNNRKKFKSRRLKKLLLSVQEASMEQQGKIIEEAFEKWRAGYEQIDDVCMFGMRI